MTSHTPGIGGYLAMWALSVLFCSLAFGVVGVADGADLTWLVVGPVVVALFAAVFSVFSAPVGLVLLHLTCHGIRQQWVHVAVAGTIGAVAGLGYAVVMFDGWMWPVPVLTLSVAAARWAVVPLVPAHRERRRPVDDDFVAGDSAC